MIRKSILIAAAIAPLFLLELFVLEKVYSTNPPPTSPPGALLAGRSGGSSNRVQQSGTSTVEKGTARSIQSASQVETTRLLGQAEPETKEAFLRLIAAESITHRARKDGNWNDPAVWGGRVPGPAARVHVPEGLKVRIEGAGTEHLDALLIDGDLEIVPSFDTTLHVDTLIVNEMGALRAGSLEHPVPGDRNVLISLEALFPPGEPADLRAESARLVSMGELSLHGEPKTGMAMLASLPQAGAREILLTAAPYNWRPDDLVVLGGNLETREERPAFQVEEVNGNRVRLTPADPTIVDWKGLETSFETNRDQLGFVVNLTRNVAVSSPDRDDPVAPNGSILIMGGTGVARTSLTHVGSYGLGVGDMVLEGSDEAINRPALSLAGDAGSGGAVLEGLVVVDAPAGNLNIDPGVSPVRDSVSYDEQGGALLSENGHPSRLVWSSTRTSRGVTALGGY